MVELLHSTSQVVLMWWLKRLYAGGKDKISLLCFFVWGKPLGITSMKLGFVYVIFANKIDLIFMRLNIHTYNFSINVLLLYRHYTDRGVAS